ncbi:MAG: type VI secretion system tube protein Hcp [Gluconacetobacter diazotrophicus]|nr:type VI secretion system tube protein Hcp [Gluconacetobacter diazotrophicus]
MAEKVNVVMQFDGVAGNSKLEKYPKWIVVDQLNLAGVWKDFALDGTNVNRKSGTMNMGFVTIVRSIDVSTHGLFDAFNYKKYKDTVTIHVVSGDGGKDTLLTCVIKTAMIMQWDRTLGQQGTGNEGLTLSGKEITLTGYGYGTDGSQNSNVPLIYDYEQMKVV